MVRDTESLRRKQLSMSPTKSRGDSGPQTHLGGGEINYKERENQAKMNEQSDQQKTPL